MSTSIPPGLHWGIKSSFLDYVIRLPDGQGSVSAGAAPSELAVFVYEPDGPEFDVVEGTVRTLKFRGDVRLSGHAGMLFVRIADPWITLMGDRVELSVVDPASMSSTSRIVLATLELEASGLPGTLHAERVALAAEATVHFNDVYSAGELLDPLTVVLPPGSRN